jgi:hypothetical protein
VIIPGCRPVRGDRNHAAACCLALRQDGVIEIVADDTETLARLNSDPDRMGGCGRPVCDQNRDTLQPATMTGLLPVLETIADGPYPMPRPPSFHVKGEHVGVVPGLGAFTEFFMSKAMNGLGGPLEAAGMLPAPREEIDLGIQTFRNGTVAGPPGGAGRSRAEGGRAHVACMTLQGTPPAPPGRAAGAAGHGMRSEHAQGLALDAGAPCGLVEGPDLAVSDLDDPPALEVAHCLVDRGARAPDDMVERLLGRGDLDRPDGAVVDGPRDAGSRPETRSPRRWSGTCGSRPRGSRPGHQ